MRAGPLAARLGLPVDARGRLVCDTSLRVQGLTGGWAAGDAAAVPDLTRPGELCGPSAQHAVRQAARLAGNIVAALRGRETRAYRHPYAGSVAGLGRHQGAAEVYGIRLIGFPAWVLHRVYRLSRVPTVDRKLRVLADWTLTALLRREVVGLAQLEHPRQDWEHATGEHLAGAA